MRDLKVVLVGIGGIARRVHLPTLIGAEGATLAGVVDVVPEILDRVGKQYNIANCYPSVAAFLQNGEADCALVVTGPAYHAEVSIALLEAGIDVFCEKPLANSLSDVRAMVDAADRSNKILMAGFNRRFMPAYQKAKRIFDEEPLELLSIEKNKESNERRALLQDGIHMVDTMRWFCGEPVDVQAWARWSEDEEHEETILANIKFDTGVLGNLIIHRNGGAWLEKAELYGGGYTVIVDAPDHTRVNQRNNGSQVYSLGGWASLPQRLGFSQEFEHFFHCVRERTQPITSGSDALKTHELVSAIYTSAGLSSL